MGAVLRASVLGLLLAAAPLPPRPAQAESGAEANARALVSDPVLSGLERMAAWGAKAVGGPAPGPGFAESARRYFTTFPQQPATVALLVRANELYPYMDRGLARMPPPARAVWAQRIRAAVDARADKPLAMAAAMCGYADRIDKEEHEPPSQRLAGMQRKMAEQTVIFNQLAMRNTWQRYDMGMMARAYGNPH